MEKNDSDLLAEFRLVYPAWREGALPFLEAADWKQAFTEYPFLRFETIPWAPLKKPLAQCRVAILSTAGVYVKGDQPPFDAENFEGDWRFREVPIDMDKEQLAIAHTHYPHRHAEQDLNVVLPLQRLKALQAEGVIGELAPMALSISGYCLQPDMIAEHSIPAMVARLQAMETDVLLHIPV